jgi:hypothetical protein
VPKTRRKENGSPKTPPSPKSNKYSCRDTERTSCTARGQVLFTCDMIYAKLLTDRSAVFSRISYTIPLSDGDVMSSTLHIRVAPSPKLHSTTHICSRVTQLPLLSFRAGHIFLFSCKADFYPI